MRRQIWQTGFIEEMREWTPEGATHDDALDAVAGCLSSEPVRLPYFSEKSRIAPHNWQGRSQSYTARADFEV